MNVRFHRCLVFAGLFAATIGCADQRSTLEPTVLRVPTPRMLIVPPSVIDQVLTVPGQGTTSANVRDLPTYTDGVVARLSIDGIISINTTNPFYKPSYEADASGHTLPGIGCYVNTFFQTTGGSWGGGPCGASPMHSHWVDTALIQGTGVIKRGPGILQWDYECNYHACWTYAGSQTYSIVPLPAAINLMTPMNQLVAPGTIEKPQPGLWVLFQVRPDPETIKGFPVPVRVISWTWQASGGGAGQTVLGGTGTQIQRAAYIMEEGTMIVDAIVNGAEQIDSLSVVVPVIRIAPAQSSMKPSVFTAKVTDPQRQDISVSVSGFNGVKIPNKPINLYAVASELTAGHSHSGGKPTGDFFGAPGVPGGSSTQINTGPSGDIAVTYQASQASGPVSIIATSPVATTATAPLTIEIQGLVPYGSGVHNDTTGGTNLHPANHFANPAHLAKLLLLADIFFQEYGTRLTFNDTSLPLGGIFDVGTGAWFDPHKAHRAGRNTDIRTNGLLQDKLDFIDTQWRKLHGTIVDETATSEPHYHLVSY